MMSDSPFIPPLSPRHRAMLQEMGVPVWWPESTALADTGERPAAPPSLEPPSVSPSPGRRAMVTTPVMALPPDRQEAVPPESGLHPATRLSDLTALACAVEACTRCPLAQGRHRAVPGSGDPKPDWLIVGEAPGEEEDRQGLPFVGRAGQLLDRMLAAMGLQRDRQVYIANVIKCRPPMNRNPEPDEIAQCSPFLLQQVQLLRPRVILAMGRFAAQTLLAQGQAWPADAVRQVPLGKLRGQVHPVNLGGMRMPVVVTYHPAYLLRNPADKAKAWADLCLAMDTMDQT